MATFDQNITAIKQAQYGYEVRDAIAEGLTQCYFRPTSILGLEYDEHDGNNNQKVIEVPIPNGNTIRIIYGHKSSQSPLSMDNYVCVGSGSNQNLIACNYSLFNSNPAHTISKNKNDGSIIIELFDTKSELNKKITIKVGYSAVEVSVLISSSGESSAGLGTTTEITLGRVDYVAGYSSSGTFYPGTIVNPNYIPLAMTDFGGPGEFLMVQSGVKTTFNGKSLFRDLSQGGRVGCHFYTRFVYS